MSLVDLKETEQIEQLKAMSPEPRGSIEGTEQIGQTEQIETGLFDLIEEFFKNVTSLEVFQIMNNL